MACVVQMDPQRIDSAVSEARDPSLDDAGVGSSIVGLADACRGAGQGDSTGELDCGSMEAAAGVEGTDGLEGVLLASG
jgi:hypothetical protein